MAQLLLGWSTEALHRRTILSDEPETSSVASRFEYAIASTSNMHPSNRNSGSYLRWYTARGLWLTARRAEYRIAQAAGATLPYPRVLCGCDSGPDQTNAVLSRLVQRIRQDSRAQRSITVCANKTAGLQLP